MSNHNSNETRKNLYVVFDASAIKRLRNNIRQKIDDVLTLPNLAKFTKGYANATIIPTPLTFEEQTEISTSICEALKKCNEISRYFEELIEPHTNNIALYGMFPLFEVIHSLKRIVNNGGYHKVYIVGGNEKVCCWTIYGTSNRETDKAIMYKPSWFYVHFIGQVFGNHKSFVFLGENSKKLLILLKLRNVIIPAGSMVKNIIKHLRISVKIRGHGKKPGDNKQILAITARSIPQLRAVNKLCNKVEKFEITPVVIWYEMANGKGVNEYINNNFNNVTTISLFKLKYVINFVKAYIGGLNKRYRLKNGRSAYISISSSEETLKLPVSKLEQDGLLLPYWMAYLSMLKAELKNLHTNKEMVVLSTEQIDKFAYFEKLAAKDREIPFFNMQTGLFAPWPYPNAAVGEKFYLSTKANFETFKKINLPSIEKITYVGPIKYIGYLGELNKSNSSGNQFIKKLLYISSPSERRLEDNLLGIVLRLIEKSVDSIHLIVKLHPRDKIEDYGDLIGKKNVTIYQDEIELYDLIENVDIAIGRRSTVLQECVYVGTPFLSCLFTEELRANPTDIHNRNNYLLCYEEKDLQIKLANYSELKHRFALFRREYLKMSEIYDDDKIVIDMLNSMGMSATGVNANE